MPAGVYTALHAAPLPVKQLLDLRSQGTYAQQRWRIVSTRQGREWCRLTAVLMVWDIHWKCLIVVVRPSAADQGCRQDYQCCCLFLHLDIIMPIR
jgi:hypothetical protein